MGRRQEILGCGKDRRPQGSRDVVFVGKELPAFLSDVDGAAAFTILQGRGVRLPKRPAIAYRPGWEVDYDQWTMTSGL